MKKIDKMYNLAWLDLKHFISKKYSEVNDLKTLAVLNEILKYIQDLEYRVNKKED